MAVKYGVHLIYPVKAVVIYHGCCPLGRALESFVDTVVSDEAAPAVEEGHAPAAGKNRHAECKYHGFIRMPEGSCPVSEYEDQQEYRTAQQLHAYKQNRPSAHVELARRVKAYGPCRHHEECESAECQSAPLVQTRTANLLRCRPRSEEDENKHPPERRISHAVKEAAGCRQKHGSKPYNRHYDVCTPAAYLRECRSDEHDRYKREPCNVIGRCVSGSDEFPAELHIIALIEEK